MEYSPKRRKRRNVQRAAAKKAVPAAGPVKVTRADGSTETQPPLTEGTDRPGFAEARWNRKVT